MIQRIQTIFLFLASAAALGLFALPIAQTPEAVSDSVLFADTQYQLEDHWSLMAAFGAGGALLLIAIFLFRNRKLQMNLTLVGLLLSAAGIGLTLFFYFSDKAAEQAQFVPGVALPALTIIFALLAHRFIKKDDNLVRSMDRLR